MIDEKILDAWFHETEVGQDQAEAYSKVLAGAKAFAEIVNQNVPDGDGKMQTIQQIRGAVLASELEIRNNWPKPQPVIVTGGKFN